MTKTRRNTMAVWAALAVFTLNGCAQTAQTTDVAAQPDAMTAGIVKTMRIKPVPLSFSAGEADQQDAADGQDEALMPETDAGTVDAAADADDSRAPETQGAEPQSQADALPAQANSVPAAQTAQQEPANATAPVPEPATPAAEITLVPQQPDPAPQPAPEPPAPAPQPTPAPAPAPAPAFDVSACVQNVKNYGVGIGLALDSTATACWDNPTTVNAQSQYAERDLCGLLDWYKGSGFTAFWVWADADGNGGYLVYIGYA